MLDAGQSRRRDPLLNNHSWVFPIHPQYSFALIHLARQSIPAPDVELAGPFASETEFLAGKESARTYPLLALLKAAASGAALPQLPSHPIRRCVHLATQGPTPGRRVRGLATSARSLSSTPRTTSTFDSGQDDGRWPVYGGRAFNIWTPDTGEYYAWASPNKVIVGTPGETEAPGPQLTHGASTAFPAALSTTLRRFRSTSRASPSATSPMRPTAVRSSRWFHPSRPHTQGPLSPSTRGTARTEAFLLGVLRRSRRTGTPAATLN